MQNSDRTLFDTGVPEVGLTKRARVWVVTAVVVVVVIGALAGAAVVLWPNVHLRTSDQALARVALTGFAGRIVAVEASSTSEGHVPLRLAHGDLWPLRQVAAGARLTVEVTVRRPGWAGWLVGHVERRSFSIETPSAHLLGRWLQVKTGAPVTVSFDAPVTLVSLHGAATRRLATPQTVVPVGVIASGASSAGAVEVAAAARSWERLPAPVKVSWFPARPYAQLLVDPQPKAKLAPAGQLTLTFSEPVAGVFGAARPRLSPVTPGRWQLLDAHTLAFQPSGLGFGLGATVRIDLPVAVHLAGQTGAGLTRTLRWGVPEGSTLRLQQLLAGWATCRSTGNRPTAPCRPRSPHSLTQPSRRPPDASPGASPTAPESCAGCGSWAGPTPSPAVP